MTYSQFVVGNNTNTGKMLIPYDVLKELLIQGVRFSYVSYNHKKALEELKTIINTGISPYHQSVDLNSFLNVPEYNWFIPDEIKLNNLVWRAGRVWEIFFNKDRRICRVKVGNRYPKNFQIEDFGVSVKPMLFKSEDTYDLIGQGLAIEENLK
jgi:hypothetical protein